MAHEEKTKAPEFVFEIDRTIEGGAYCNMANVIHNKNEFLIDFAMVIPGKNGAKVMARIITSPQHAKQFLNALGTNLSRFEQTYGEIKIDGIMPIIEKTQLVH